MGLLARVQAKEENEKLASLKKPFQLIAGSINALVIGSECKCGGCGTM